MRADKFRPLPNTSLIFRLDTVKRADLIALTEEAAKVSGIPYIMDAGMEEAEKILNS